METDYWLIDTDAKLDGFVKTLEKATVVAVDLEADSMYHFQEKVCLIQMATAGASVVIDPIQIKDMSPLKPFFSDPEVKKIIHGADYDVRSLYRDFKIEINNLFDTQIACMYLGFKETGLDAVLKQKFNIGLDKKYQRKDWSLRPLPEQMVAYAVADVVHLISLAQLLEKELQNMGRLDWVYEESTNISRVRPAIDDGRPLFLKFRGAGRLYRRNLAALEGLLQFRVRKAQKKDKPLFKIFSNNAIMKIALALPRDLAGLENLKAFSLQQIEIYGRSVVQIVNKVVGMPEKKLPVYPQKPTPPVQPGVSKRVRALKSWRDSKSQLLGIDPGFFFNNALISLIAAGNPLTMKDLEKIMEMKNWQKREFGQEIIAVLKNVK